MISTTIYHPDASMYGILTFIWVILWVKVGKCTIHEVFGIGNAAIRNRWVTLFSELKLWFANRACGIAGY